MLITEEIVNELVYNADRVRSWGTSADVQTAMVESLSPMRTSVSTLKAFSGEPFMPLGGTPRDENGYPKSAAIPGCDSGKSACSASRGPMRAGRIPAFPKEDKSPPGDINRQIS